MSAQPLNPLTLPLTDTRLIEASAGTGKTYNIAALFVRLVLVEHMTVERILVVTFTKTATAELKTRLRNWLGQALAKLRGGTNAKANDTLQSLIQQARQHESDERLILRLQAALNQFDGAAIYTIHAFCQRVLSDYAFFCGTPFDIETAETDALLLHTFAQDFWRQHINHHSRYAPLAAQKKLTPQTVLDELGNWLSYGNLTPRLPENTDLASAEDALAHCWKNLRPQAVAMADLYWRIKPQKLNGNKFQDRTFTLFFEDLVAAATADNPHYPFRKADKFANFSAVFLQQNSKKNQHLSEAELVGLAPLADFGTALANLQATQENTLLHLKIEAFTHIRQQLAEHKRRSRQRSYHDLLNDVDAALSASNPQARALAQALAAQWHIALIDEFQDTDPLQYRIFKTAFADQGRPLLMVGDPKQAIYRFRGADIHAYLQAAKDTPASQCYTLQTNYRSHRALMAGIGHLFGGKTHPFVLEGISYTKVSADRADSHLSPAAAATHIRWLHDETETNEQPNKDLLRTRAANACADEIAATITQGLSGSLQQDGRPLCAGDIAVLVRTHKEGKMVAGALRKRGVASVSLANRSVFADSEAMAVAALLAFWLQPQRGSTLRFVLGSNLFGYSAAELHDLNQDEQRISMWNDRAQHASDCWQQHGIYAALQHFAAVSELESGLLARQQERSLTNFWQLAELLAEFDADSPSCAATHQWLQHKIAQSSHKNIKQNNQSDADQLRLESDAALVKIVTVHAAKGLEYPIVYCPFVWDGKDPSKKQPWVLLHRASQTQLVHESLLSEAERAAMMDDDMGELLRLYYVAFTRARERLVLYAAACSHTANSPFGYLLGTGSSVADTQEFWKQQKPAGISALAAAWQQCVRTAENGLFAWHTGTPPAATVAPRAAPAQAYRALMLPERHFTRVRHTSFTALSRHADATDTPAPHIDAAEAEEAPSPADTQTTAETALLGFARGMGAGLCLHAVLENTDFAHAAAAQSDVYAPILAQYGFADARPSAITAMVDAVRRAPLWPASTLADIPAQQRLPEMGFVLHVRDFALPKLRHWLAQPHIGLPENCVAAAGALDFANVNGFLNGFIDLVCQDEQGRVAVVDYKSNHLGMRLSDYRADALNRAVAEHHYYLQALIYTIAVARYLGARQALPEYIAVRYLFVRGLNPYNDAGIWRWDIHRADLATWL